MCWGGYRLQSFNSILSGMGYLDILEFEEYKDIHFNKSSNLMDILDTVIANNLRTYVIGDYDVDGLMCNVTVKDTFDYIGYTNYEIFQYKERTHNIDKQAIRECIEGRFDCVIIMDTGSAELGILKRLVSYGVVVIVLDHHVSNSSYSDFDIPGLTIINTILENELLDENRYKLSAGALVFAVCKLYIQHLGLKELKSIRAYALISLYADCMDMANKINRSIYYLAMELSSSELPTTIRYFTEKYRSFTRRVIEFNFSPRINSMFRSENFQYINYLFLTKETDAATTASCLEIIEEIYTNNREFINKISDIIKVTEMDNFVVANIRDLSDRFDIEQNKLYNYTGLISNQISTRYEKPAVVYCENSSNIKGSLRDLYGRDYLSIFSNFCKAGGHKPAFGITLDKLELNNFLSALKRVDEHYSLTNINNSPIILKYEVSEPLKTLIYDMALYNDFSGDSIPVAYISKSYIGNIKEKKTKYGMMYWWGDDFKIQTQRTLNFGENLLLKPIKSHDVRFVV